MNANERDAVYRRFRGAVNMNARQLRQSLDTDESKTVASAPGQVSSRPGTGRAG